MNLHGSPKRRSSRPSRTLVPYMINNSCYKFFLDAFQFNTVIAVLMKLSNVIRSVSSLDVSLPSKPPSELPYSAMCVLLLFILMFIMSLMEL